MNSSVSIPNPYKDDIVLFFRPRVVNVNRNPWEPNDEIAQLGYFGRLSGDCTTGSDQPIRVFGAGCCVEAALRET